MRYVTVISRTTPKVRRPVEKKEHYISSSLRKTPIRLSKSRKFTIGRSSKSSLPLKSGTISATHASIKWNKSAFKIRDERSTNGTFVNGKRISGITPLKDGDKIRLGQFVLTFSARKVRTKKDGAPKKKASKKKASSRKRAASSRRTHVSRKRPSARRTSKRRPAAKRRPPARRTARKRPLYTKIFGAM
jgi:pSer/pThr/pTyr-binding forkhead associated (FHA) protein